MLILSRSISKHGHHMQFLFLIGRFLKKSSPLKLLSHMNRNLVGSIYICTCMKGSVLSFLKAEWKVSDTGSAHWASSLDSLWNFLPVFFKQFWPSSNYDFWDISGHNKLNDNLLAHWWMQATVITLCPLSYVSFSHFKLLLWNLMSHWKQTCTWD